VKKEISMKNTILAVAAVAAALFIPCPAAGQDDLTCNSTYTGGTYGNVTVPPNDSCTLVNVRVVGNVTAGQDSSLQILGGGPGGQGSSTIKGDVKVDDCYSFDLQADTTPPGWIIVGGNLTINGCSQFVGIAGLGNLFEQNIVIGKNTKCNNGASCNFAYAVFAGDFECSGNAGNCGLYETSIGGNATFNNNLGGFGLWGYIGGDLHCSGNAGVYNPGDSLIPFVAGTCFGQCAPQD
jgi:hypothetical protein